MTSSPAILFMGTPQFAATALQGLIGAGFNVTGVITRPDAGSGRGGKISPSEVKKEAEKAGIPVFQPANKAEVAEMVKKVNPEIIVVAAFGMIIPQEVLDIPKYGALNIHGSLLPKYRGASPITEAILNGDTETGITIIKMSAGMDEGPRIKNYELRIENEDTTGTLTEKMAELGAKAIVETIPNYITGKLTETKQDDAEATYCSKITKKDGHIDWNLPAEQIERMVRAYTPWPTAYTFIGDKRLKILKTKVTNKSYPTDQFTFEDNQIFIGSLEILELQPEGKKPMSAGSFMSGNRDLITRRVN